MYRFEHYELSTDAFQLLDNGEPVRIEPQVFDVLAYLVEHRERVVSKEELLDEVWGDRFVSESALTTRIKMARRAVGDDGRTQRLIRNSHGRGYQFIGEVASPPAEPDRDPVTDSRTSIGTPTSSNDQARADAVPQLEATRHEPLTSAEFALLVDEEFDFVGRQALLARAAKQIDRAVAGGSGAVLIGGEPGIGKTRLASQIAHQGQQTHDLLALAGRCDRHLSSSLQPWLEALGAYVSSASAGALEADTEGLVHHLAPIFPTLLSRLGSADGTPAAAVDQYAVLDALVVLVERISARVPLIIVLDDVQWAGGPTRALASLLLRRGLARVLLVMTVRTTVDDLDDSTRDWLNEVAAIGSVERFDLTTLDAGELDALLDGLDADASIRDQIRDLSGGHALFATELLRDVRRGRSLPQLPDTVASLVRSRLDHLPADVSALVSVSAAIGPDFDLSIAGGAAGLSADAALVAIETALEAELVHEVAGAAERFRFSHQLVPAAILESMSSARRVRLHARIAEELKNRFGPGPSVAFHLLEAFPVLDANDVLRRVRTTAAAALTEHQYDTAAELLLRCSQLAVEPRQRAELLSELGQAYNAAGRQPEALAPFEEAAEAARSHGWSDLLIGAAIGRWGESPFRASQDRTVIPLLDEALELVDPADGVVRARLLAKRAAFTLFTAALSERDTQSGLAEQLVGADASPDRLAVLEARWMAIACPETVHQIAPIDEELTRLRKELGALTTDACAPEIGFYWRGDGEELWRVADELDADPRQRRSVDQWRTATLAGTEALFAGRLAEARELTDVALPLGKEPWGESGEVVHALVHLLIDVLDGVPGQSLDRWRAIAGAVPSDNMVATRAWVEALSGDQQLAGDLLSAVAPRVAGMAENFMGGFGLVGVSEAVLALERTDLVPALRSVLEPLNDRMLGHPWAPSLAAADVLSRLDHMVGDDDAALANRTLALDLYQRLGATSLSERL